MKTQINEAKRMQRLAGLINEDIDNWGDEKDDYGRSERDYRPKPSLADFDYDEEEYRKYMEINFPGEPLDLDETINDLDEVVNKILEKLRKK